MPPLMLPARGSNLRRRRLLVALSIAASALGVLVGSARADEAPALGDGVVTLRYERQRTISEGTGLLEGYAEASIERGTYTLERRLGPDATPLVELDVVRATRHQGANACRFAEEQRRAEVELSTRIHRGASELDDAPGAGASTWLWIPPSTPAGASVRVLAGALRVERDVDLEVGNTTISTILASRSEQGERDAPPGFLGEAGRFRRETSIEVWFDEASGYVVRAERWEIAENERAAFEERDVYAIVDAPYLPASAQSLWVPVAPCASAERGAPPRWPWLLGACSIVLVALGGLVALRRRLTGASP